jgi:hypothetical protein
MGYIWNTQEEMLTDLDDARGGFEANVEAGAVDTTVIEQVREAFVNADLMRTAEAATIAIDMAENAITG